MDENNRTATKSEIRRQLTRYLRNAREKEELILAGLAHEYCTQNDVHPSSIELVRVDRGGGEMAFFFRKRPLLHIPNKEIIT